MVLVPQSSRRGAALTCNPAVPAASCCPLLNPVIYIVPCCHNCHSTAFAARYFLTCRSLSGYRPLSTYVCHVSDLWTYVCPTASYSTVYACEGSTLNLECGEDELINLIRANFGRFSITICNQKGNTDWSVNCMSPRSLRVLEQR